VTDEVDNYVNFVSCWKLCLLKMRLTLNFQKKRRKWQGRWVQEDFETEPENTKEATAIHILFDASGWSFQLFLKLIL